MTSSSDPGRSTSAGGEPRAVSRPPSADEREAAIARLSSAFAYEILSMEEFERRVADVYRATSIGTLARLVEDLPREEPDAEGRGGRALVPASPMKPRLAVVFGSAERSGRVLIPRHLDLRAIFGNIELDFREAEFDAGVTEIHVEAIFGNVEIRLPAHVVMENEGETFLGNFSTRVKGRKKKDPLPPPRPGPVVRLTGNAVFGNVEVEREKDASG